MNAHVISAYLYRQKNLFKQLEMGEIPCAVYEIHMDRFNRLIRRELYLEE